ncbi:MAG: RND transporter [Lentisphaerae bacterium GWF2_44_16]|nr:MAG: RND transporter [Lentisphaerae bacterium GWF2_44_16]
MKTIVITIVIIALLAAYPVWYFLSGKTNGVTYKTTAVKRGNITVAISATGTVEPEELVDVGAQIAGQIVSFGKDKNGKAIDYGSEVEEGSVLAMIDDSLYLAEAAQVRAQLQQAKASQLRAEADLDQMKAKHVLAQNDWGRAQKLRPAAAIAEASYDSYKSSFDTAKANLAIGEAAILQAKASVMQTEAALKKAERNLSYCTIKSPVKGIVIDRRVNIGQTVVASLNAPSLFLIAKDLKRMQVWVNVNEADIGKIYPKQPVSFTVDAYPGETFIGEVGKIRLNATMSQNVVTYIVEIITDNSSGRLLPYLTANVQFKIVEHKDIFFVPNSALKWLPSSAQFPSVREEKKDNSSGKKATSAKFWETNSKGILWSFENNQLAPLDVTCGITNGIMTEVSGSAIKEGLEVVTGEKANGGDSKKSNPSNPFVPKIGRGGKK